MRRSLQCLSLILALTLLCCACAHSEKSAPTLSLYMDISTTDVESLAMVREALDAYVYEKLGFHVQLHSPDSYGQTLTEDLRAGVQVDAAMVFSGIGTLAAEGLVMPLDELLETKGEGIARSINEAYIRDARINGHLYAFPTNRDRHTTYGFAYNQDIADQYGLDLSGVTKLDDLTPIFAQLQTQTTEITPSVVVSSTPIYGIMDSLGDSFAVLTFDDIDKVVNYYETEEFETIIRLIYDWNQAGYLLDQSTEGGSYTYYLGSGQILGSLVRGHAIFAAQESKFGESNVSYIALTPACYTASNASRLGYAIPTTALDPELSMELLNLLYTDTYAANLLMYGIEDVHYTRCPYNENVLCYPDIQTPEHYTGMDPWKYCNQYAADRWNVYEEGIWEKVEQANLSAVRSPAVGFSFDSTPVSRQYQNCSDVVDEYMPILKAGLVDPDEILPEFLQALEAAGAEAVITEKQRQLDQYILSSNQ